MSFKKILLTGTLFSLSVSPGAFANLSDDLDKNTTQAPLEEREEEVINSSDVVDENYTPAYDEKREKEEEVESDLIQGDDPGKTYNYEDEEFDESN
jgi:hypothetical protein